MAITYGFYNSLNGDRKYDAEDVSQIFNGVITDGVFSTIGGAMMTVAGTGMQVVVKAGKCWFNGTWTINDAQLPLDIEAADVSLTRIDAVVVEIDKSTSTRANTIKVLKGSPSANPEKPNLTKSELVNQYALAYVTIPGGMTSISASNIDIVVGKTETPFVTAVLQQADITDLFNGWTDEFETWFENIKSQLAGDIATNLQKQIDERVKIADKASNDDVLAGTNDTKWVTPAKLKKLRDDIQLIGDVKFTIRDSLDANWRKADGSMIDLSQYPDYADLITATATPSSGWAKTTTFNSVNPSNTCAHGYYVVQWTVGISETNEDYYALTLSIYDIRTDTTTTKVVEHLMGNGNGSMSNFISVMLTYQNGYWIFVAYDLGGTYTITSNDDLETFSMQVSSVIGPSSDRFRASDANQTYIVFGGWWIDSSDHYRSWYMYANISNPASTITWNIKTTNHGSKYAYPFRGVKLYGNMMEVLCNYTGSTTYIDYEKMYVGASFSHSASGSRYDANVSVKDLFATKTRLYEYLSTGLFSNGTQISLPSGFQYVVGGTSVNDRCKETKDYIYLIGTIDADTVILKIQDATATEHLRVASSIVPRNAFNEINSDTFFMIGNVTNYGAYLPNISIDGCNAFVKVK